MGRIDLFSQNLKVLEYKESNYFKKLIKSMIHGIYLKHKFGCFRNLVISALISDQMRKAASIKERLSSK